MIAVDGGIRYLDLEKFQPDLWIGDFDSSRDWLNHLSAPERQQLFSDIPRQNFPVRKDQTDSELAVDYALAYLAQQADPADCWEIFLLAAFGSRYDHLLANQLLCTGRLIDLATGGKGQKLRFFLSDGLTGQWLVHGPDRLSLDFPSPSVEQRAEKWVFSALALQGQVQGLTYQASYPLNQANLPFASSLGTSNYVDTQGSSQARATAALEVSLSQGILSLFITPED